MALTQTAKSAVAISSFSRLVKKNCVLDIASGIFLPLVMPNR